MKTCKHYLIVERKKAPEPTATGIYRIENTATNRGVKAILIDAHEDVLDGIKIGDTVYVDKTKAIDIEGKEDWFFVEPQYILGWEAK